MLDGGARSWGLTSVRGAGAQAFCREVGAETDVHSSPDDPGSGIRYAELRPIAARSVCVNYYMTF